MKYVEQQNEVVEKVANTKNYYEVLDWEKTLTDLLEREEKGEDVSIEVARLEGPAGDWVTCACGNLCDVIPRHEDGKPEDIILVGLGLAFCSHIEDNEIGVALDTLAQIEKRSSELINELNLKS